MLICGHRRALVLAEFLILYAGAAESLKVVTEARSLRVNSQAHPSPPPGLCQTEENHGVTFYDSGDIYQCFFPQGAVKIGPCSPDMVRNIGTAERPMDWCIGRYSPVPDSIESESTYNSAIRTCGAGWAVDSVLSVSASAVGLAVSTVQDCSERGLSCIYSPSGMPHCGVPSLIYREGEGVEESGILDDRTSVRLLEKTRECTDGWYGVECSKAGDVVRCTGHEADNFVLDMCSSRGASCVDKWDGVAYCSDRVPLSSHPFECSAEDRAGWNVSYCHLETGLPNRAFTCTPGGKWVQSHGDGLCFLDKDRIHHFFDPSDPPSPPPKNKRVCSRFPPKGKVKVCKISPSGKCRWKAIASCSDLMMECFKGQCVDQERHTQAQRMEKKRLLTVSGVEGGGGGKEEGDDGDDERLEGSASLRPHEVSHLPPCDPRRVGTGEVYGCYPGGLAECYSSQRGAWVRAAPDTKAEVLGVSTYTRSELQTVHIEDASNGKWKYVPMEGVSISQSPLSSETIQLVGFRNLEFVSVQVPVREGSEYQLMCPTSPGMLVMCSSPRAHGTKEWSIVIDPSWRWWNVVFQVDVASGLLVVKDGVHLRVPHYVMSGPFSISLKVGVSACSGKEYYVSSHRISVSSETGRDGFDERIAFVIILACLVACVGCAICIRCLFMNAETRDASVPM